MTLTLADIRDWLESLGIADNHYVGRLDNKKERSIGVYARARAGRQSVPLGGPARASYGVRRVSILVHWNRNAAESEAAALALWEAVGAARAVPAGGGFIQYAQLTVPEPVGVGTDKSGVYEYVIEMNIYYRR